MCLYWELYGIGLEGICYNVACIWVLSTFNTKVMWGHLVHFSQKHLVITQKWLIDNDRAIQMKTWASWDLCGMHMGTFDIKHITFL